MAKEEKEEREKINKKLEKEKQHQQNLLDHRENFERQERSEQQRIEISTAVARTHEVLREIIKNDSASNCNMAWYVQPYDRSSSSEGPFKNGIYPGINWMIRAMQKQNCTCKTY